ncbi:4-hydroxybenzoate octaprenyltransferase [Aliirhizobium smilacinae]|uniref:4-hydroxybenzoate octaprenyltransferase n=1 Tax=Aliirhizobium smilacinae TaxID=1395944 RepID=A0A5C4XU96_9HYPH|nr:4-hydroxybenzoate octaprenyltransferase [Rhizobium smilacinae]TNM66777.1 4-hydroxybenzoate octaprenyltransferase [Rhizobium smilacinae]
MTNTPDLGARVADAPSDNFVYRVLPRSLWGYSQLARWDRPIGWQLLMWPCFWSIALAADAAHGGLKPSFGTVIFYLFLMFVGSVAMRGAGCTYNDLVDHDIDMEVARTRSRPLPSGRVSRFGAKVFIALQALVGLLVLIQFNTFSIVLGIASLAVVAIYPFAKRFTDWPQFFLGLAFSWGALMGWAAIFGGLSWAAIFLYIGAVAWTIGYDTIYAYQDIEDDELIGVRSTARLFGDKAKPCLVGLYGITLLFLALSFITAGAGFFAYVGLIVTAVMLGWQILILDIRNPDQCRRLFLSNNRVGAILFVGLALSLIL